MGSFATLRQMGVLDGKKRGGLLINNQFISYFQFESALYNFPKVLEAGVIVQCNWGEDEKLKIYLALEDSFTSVEECKRYCANVEGYVRQKFSIEMP
ncbi:MAG: hypothetical protein WCR27_07645, partial [Eubacteriales bacterium]